MQRSKKKTDVASDVFIEKKPAPNITVLKCEDLPVPRLSQGGASAIVALCALVCFFTSFGGDFVFDDKEAILNNRDVKLQTSFLSIFKHDFWGDNITSAASHKSYRPFTVWTFRLNYWASGYNSVGFHIINITLHVLNSILALRVYSVLFGGISVSNQGIKVFLSPKSSFLAAMVFACHPVHTENVAGIVGRADLLSAFFFFVSFLCYTRTFSTGSRQTASSLPEKLSSRSLGACITFAVLALLSKEQGITVLGLCIVYDIIQIFAAKKNAVLKITKTATVNKEDELWLKTSIKRLSILAITAGILLFWRMKIMDTKPPKFQQHDNPAAFAHSWLIRVVNYNYIYCLNIWLLLNPLWLCFDWAMGCVPLITSANDVRLLAPFLLWLFITLLLWKCWTLRDSHMGRTMLMLLAFIIIPFLPSTNIFFSVGFVIAERNLYLSSFGHIGLVILGSVVLSQNKHCGKILWICSCLLIFISVLRCIQRSQDWLSEKSLFKSGEKVCPLNAKVHYNIGHVLSQKGDTENAIKYYKESIRLTPTYDQPLNNLGNLLQLQGKLLEAEELLTKAVNVSPSFAAAWMNLGITKAHLKNFKGAEKCYMNAIKHRKIYPDAYYNLGNMYLDMKAFKKAVAAYQTVIEMKPDHESSWINLILLNEEIGLPKISMELGEKAAKLMPKSAAVLFTLGNLYGKADKYKEAETYYHRAIQLDPNQASYNGNMAVLYHRWGKYKEAKEYYARSLKLDPNNQRTVDNYKKLQRTLSEKA